MQSVVAWLVARPQYAVAVMAATLLVPVTNLLGGAVLVLLVLRQGTRLASVQATLAVVLLAVMAVVLQDSIVAMLANAAFIFLPAFAFATMLVRTRSITLTMQVLLVVSVSGILLFYVAVSDVVEFWEPWVNRLAILWQEVGLDQQAANLLANYRESAGQLTTMLAVSIWLSVVCILYLGYWLYDQLPGSTATYGRISDVDFGRVIGVCLAVASILAFVTKMAWIESVAFLLFVAFWLQGLSIVHWLQVEGYLPTAAVAAIYILMLVLQAYLFSALAVLGYTDAWFRYRRRATKQQ